MRIDHRCFNILVTQQFLNRPNVRPIFQHVCGEAVSQSMRNSRLGDTRQSQSFLKRLTECFLVYVMAAKRTASWIP